MVTAMRSFSIVALLTAIVLAGGCAAPSMALILVPPADAPAVVASGVHTVLSMPDYRVSRELAGVSLSPSERTVQVLTDFALDILVNCGTHADAAAVEVAFDPAYMQVIAVTQDESSFPTVLRNRFDNVAGIVYYDAGALQCHSEDSCPAGVIRIATITFRAIARTFPTKDVGVSGQVLWAGDLIFDGQGSGSTITITSSVSPVYLPLVVRGAR